MSKQFAALLKRAKSTYHFLSSRISMDFAKDVERAMKVNGVNKSELAGLIGSSPAYVTKLLRGDANYTVETMAKVAVALDADVHIRFVSKKEGVWSAPAKRSVVYGAARFKSYQGNVANDCEYKTPAAA